MDENSSRFHLPVLCDVSNRHHALFPASAAAAGPSKHRQRQRLPASAVVVTSSGFRGTAKQQIQDLVSQFGASYSGELVHGSTTHLVCKRLIDCFATPKYQRALEWGIHIVSFDWLVASAAAGHPVPEHDFKDDALDALKPSPAPRPATRHQQHQHQHLQRQHAATEGLCTGVGQQPQLQQQCSAQAADAPESLLQTVAGCSADPKEHLQDTLHTLDFAAAEGCCNASAAGSSLQGLLCNRQLSPQLQDIQQQQQQAKAAAGQLQKSPSSVQAGTGLFSFASELPSNFLLLGSDSPRSEASEASGLSTSSLQQQQQQPQPQPEAEQQHLHQQPQCELAAAAGPGFQFHMRAVEGSQQQTSPCMQSFLPMLQHEQQQAQDLATVNSCTNLSITWSGALVGSELQPDGINDLPNAAGPLLVDSAGHTAAAHQDSAGSAAAALEGPAAASGMTGSGSAPGQSAAAALAAAAAEETAGGQVAAPVRLLIPETQFAYEVGVGAVAAGAGAAAAAGGLQLPCKTPDSLAHYVSKQRRRQKAQENQAQPQLHTTIHPGSAEAPVERPASPDAAAWPKAAAACDEPCDAAAAAGSCDRGDSAVDQPQTDSSGVVEEHKQVHDGCTMNEQQQQQQQQDCAVVEQQQQLGGCASGHCNTARCSSNSGGGGSISSEAVGFVRLRRRDGYRRQGLGADTQTAVNPDDDDMADLEDSDCDLGEGLEESDAAAGGRGSCGSPYHPPYSSAGACNDDSYSNCNDGDCNNSSHGGNGGNVVAAAADDELGPTQVSDWGAAAAAEDTAAGQTANVRELQRSGLDSDPSAAAAGGGGAAALALAAAFAHGARGRRRKRLQPHAARDVAAPADIDDDGACSWQQLQDSPVHSCSGSSLPADSYSFTGGSDDHGNDDGSCCPAEDRCSGAAASGESGAAASTAAAGASGSRSSMSVQTGHSSQCALPVMRLNFSLGGGGSSSTSSQQQHTPAHHTPSQLQELQHLQQGCRDDSGDVQQSGAAGDLQESEDDDATCCTEGSGLCADDDADAAWSPVSGCCSRRDDSASDAQSSHSSSRLSSSSGRRSSIGHGGKLRLKQRSAAAGETAATAAAMMQKRQALKQQQQQHGGHLLTTPPSESSQFVTRRRCPRPTGVAAATVGDDGRRQGFDDAADLFDSDTDTDSEQGQSELASMAEAEAAPAAAQASAAQQLLHDVKRNQQQLKHGINRPADKCKMQRQKPQKHRQQQQQQPHAAEALLQHLRKQEEQRQHQQEDGVLVQVADEEDICAGAALSSMTAAAAGDVRTFAGVSTSSAAAAAVKPRLSVSSSCAGTELSTASHKLPLQLQGGGIILQSCSPTSSSASFAPDDGLERALHKQLAAAAKPADRLQPAAHQPQQQMAGASATYGSSSSHAVDDKEQLGTSCSSSSGGLSLQQQQQQGACEPGDGEGVSWLHTPEDPQQQHKHQQQQDQQVDLIGLSTVGVAARGGAAMSKHLGARLAQMSQAQEEVVALKLLQKAPRGSTAKAHHNLKSTSKLTYADQVQVPWARATFSTKERSRCVIMAGSSEGGSGGAGGGGGAGAGGGGGGGVFLGEPVAFYKLPTGEWWVELLRFYSAKDLRELAKTAGHPVHLPSDFQLSHELLRSMQHEHWPMRQVQGEFKLSKVRKAPAGARSRAQSPFFWRYSVDASTFQLLTDRPVTDFLVQ